MQEADWGAHLLKKCTGENATEYHRNTFIFLQELARSVKFRKKDGQILVTGERGIGKTSSALAGSFMLTQPELGSISFDLKKNTCYSAEYIGDIVENAGMGSECDFVIDESLDIMDSRDSLSRVNKAISKFMNSARKMRHIFWWCIADTSDIDNRIKNRIIKYWIHVYHQSEHNERDKRYVRAALFRKDLNPFNPDKWGLQDVSRQKKAITNHDELYRLFKRVKSYCGDLAFPILPQSVEDEYELLSKQAVAQRGADFNKNFGRKTAPEATPPVQNSPKE